MLRWAFRLMRMDRRPSLRLVWRGILGGAVFLATLLPLRLCLIRMGTRAVRPLRRPVRQTLVRRRLDRARVQAGWLRGDEGLLPPLDRGDRRIVDEDRVRVLFRHLLRVWLLSVEGLGRGTTRPNTTRRVLPKERYTLSFVDDVLSFPLFASLLFDDLVCPDCL